MASAEAIESGIERALVDLGPERDRGTRIAIWSMLYLLGHGPDLEVTFKDPADRGAARNLMDLLAASEGQETNEGASI